VFPVLLCTVVTLGVGLSYWERNETWGAQASAAKWVRTALFWAVTQRVLVIRCRLSGIINTRCVIAQKSAVLMSVGVREQGAEDTVYAYEGGWGELDKSAYGGASWCVLSPYSIRVIKSRTVRWAGHVARVDKKSACRILVVKPERKRTHWSRNYSQ
jgi:hypothetical protein